MDYCPGVAIPIRREVRVDACVTEAANPKLIKAVDAASSALVGSRGPALWKRMGYLPVEHQPLSYLKRRVSCLRLSLEVVRGLGLLPSPLPSAPRYLDYSGQFCYVGAKKKTRRRKFVVLGCYLVAITAFHVAFLAEGGQRSARAELSCN